jgi:hypothetical protein
MIINFGETFEIVQECFTETSITDSIVGKLESVTIIRDIKGKIRLFLEPSTGKKIEELAITDLNNILATSLGKYYGNDIWLPAGEKDPYKALIKTIKDERVFADWDDGSVLPR